MTDAIRVAMVDPASGIVADVLEAMPGFALDGFTLVPSATASKGDVFDPGSGEFSTPLPPIAGLKAARAAAVDNLSAEKVAAGFTYDFGSPTGPKLLQTRDGDKPNWLALATTATIMVIGGHGSDPCGAIRTADNVNVPVTALQAQTAMLAMQAALAARIAHGWSLKDEIAASNDQAALDAIDITAGWPTQAGG